MNIRSLFKHLPTIRVALLVAASLLCFTACTHDEDEDGVPDKKDKCKGTPTGIKVDANGCPIKEKEIGHIHFYLETSASMGGYFQKNSEYLEIVTDVTSKIDKQIKPIDIWFTAETTQKYSGSVQQFSSDIATTKIADKKSSQLHKILADIAARNDSNDISLLVSDCILSFPDADITNNPNINKDKASSTLKNNIYSTFADLKKKGLATSIYAFTAKFFTDKRKKIFYYDCQNGKHEIDGGRRPFYIWVIGNKELLGKFNSKLATISTFKPEKHMHFGLNEEPVTEYSIIPQIELKGDWEKCKTGIKVNDLKKEEPVQFCIACNLESLPEYTKDITYLKNNLKIETLGCDATFEVKDKTKVDCSKLKNGQQIESYKNATHTILFKVSAMPQKRGNIVATLPLTYDTWYMDWSQMDDTKPELIGEKTFALEHLITGVKEAYETKNTNYLNFLITLNK